MIIRVKKSTYKELSRLLDPSNCKKISAIKAVRADSKCGLREAKEAVELFMYEKGLSRHPVETEHKIYVGPTIKKMVVDYGKGEIEIDLEGMELKALVELQSIGIDDCSDILNLVSTLKAYEEGKSIGVVEDNDVS